MSRSTVLLVDDEPNILSALRRTLLGEELIVRTATGPEQALRMLSENPVDLIVSDHDMPDMTGLRFLTLVRERFPDTMRMMLSGKTSLETALKAVNTEVIHRFLVKPWEEEELRIMIRQAIKHRSDLARVEELSRLLQRQAALFAEIVARHPDCQDLVERYFTAEPPGAAGEREPAPLAR